MHGSLGSDRNPRDNITPRCVTLRERFVSGAYRPAAVQAALDGHQTPRTGRGYASAVISKSPVLSHRNLWSIDALTRADVLALFDTARQLRRAERAGRGAAPLRGKNLALLCDAPGRGASVLRRAAVELGAQVAQLRPSDSHLHNGELDATARLLGRLYDAIDCTAMPATLIERVESDAGVPVYNGLGDENHPTHALADLLGVHERSGKPLAELRVAYLGDARTPRSDALLQAAALTGIELRIAAPAGQEPTPARLRHAEQLARQSQARLRLVDSADEAAREADVVIDANGGERWALRAGGVPVDDAERASDWRYTLQALLVNTMT